MTYPKVCLRRGEETGVRAGKPWIFENQLDWADDVCKDGGIVDVLDSRMRFAARGYFNSKSKITVRVLTRDENEVIDRDFFRRRIEQIADLFERTLNFDTRVLCLEHIITEIVISFHPRQHSAKAFHKKPIVIRLEFACLFYERLTIMTHHTIVALLNRLRISFASFADFLVGFIAIGRA